MVTKKKKPVPVIFERPCSIRCSVANNACTGKGDEVVRLQVIVRNKQVTIEDKNLLSI